MVLLLKCKKKTSKTFLFHDVAPRKLILNFESPSVVNRTCSQLSHNYSQMYTTVAKKYLRSFLQVPSLAHYGSSILWSRMCTLLFITRNGRLLKSIVRKRTVPSHLGSESVDFAVSRTILGDESSAVSLPSSPFCS